MLDGNKILKYVNSQKSYLISMLKERGDEIVEQSAQPTINKAQRDEFKKFLLGELEKSSPLYWDANIRDAAVEGQEIFAGRGMSAFSPKLQLWLSEYPEDRGDDYVTRRTITLPPEKTTRYGSSELAVIAELLVAEEREVSCIGILEPPLNQIEAWNSRRMPPFIIVASCCKSGSTIGAEDYLLEIEACLNFISQPFVERTSLDRVVNFSGAHHQAKKNEAKKVQIVYLRRREQHPTINGQPNPVDWSCRWLVRGHWRNQYHPSDGSRKPTFIQSYVKGPEDKPFRASPGKIYAAVR